MQPHIERKRGERSIEGFPNEVLQLIPTAEKHQQAVALTDQLNKAFWDVSKRLQSEGDKRVPFADALALFDGLIEHVETPAVCLGRLNYC